MNTQTQNTLTEVGKLFFHDGIEDVIRLFPPGFRVAPVDGQPLRGGICDCRSHPQNESMKTRKTLALTLTVLGASIFIACAQDDGSPPPDGGGGPGGGGGFGGRHHHPPIPLVEALDVNHDGIIDSNEIANASAELLTLDTNGDGVLTTNEYLPTPPPDNGDFQRRHFDPANIPLVKALDVNGDGVIDANEIANAPAELKTLDKNGDGQLTRDDYIGRPPHRGPGGNGPDGGGGPGGDGGGPPHDSQN
jgi:hypothetical protein